MLNKAQKQERAAAREKAAALRPRSHRLRRSHRQESRCLAFAGVKSRQLRTWLVLSMQAVAVLRAADNGGGTADNRGNGTAG